MRVRKHFLYGGLVLAIFIALIGGGVVASLLSKKDNFQQPEEPRSTQEILRDIRQRMRDPDLIPEPIQAYILPSVDAHQTEYISVRDRRVAYVSEFTGSNAFVIIAEEEAALWTDTRYYLQASQQLDPKYWILMKDGLPETPSHIEWLNSVLPPNSKVGTDAFLLSSTNYNNLANSLKTYGHELVSIEGNLVDKVWTDRPSLVLGDINPLEFKYTGKKIQDKIELVRTKVKNSGATSIVVTALDDIAWLLNLRGTDIANNPVFYSYVTITENDISLFLHEGRITTQIAEHFANEGVSITIRNYDEILAGVRELVDANNGKILISTVASAAIYNVIPVEKLVQVYSPVALLKCIKTENEANGMRSSHIRDGAALVRYLHWLEENVDTGTISEYSGAQQLKAFRSEEELNQGTSFGSISAFGSNAAIVHYGPKSEDSKIITRNEVYLIDSGGQYFDGTTDVTRTIHMGTPKPFERECFTRVLKGYLSLGTAVFPTGAPGNFLDALARKSLWDVGLDYGHGTGHGIGSFLGVHEYPPTINSGVPILGATENMFCSNEPGYYQDGEFGIRIESIVQFVPANVMYDFGGRGALTLYTVTMAPIQLKMMDPQLLTNDEIRLIDDYHLQVRELVGELLQSRGYNEAHDWLVRETQNVSTYFNL